MIQKILSGVVALIGVVMIAWFWGAWPPMLSGTAFVLLGLKAFLD